jgi:transglutaminase-like putative cysteine protease
MRLNRLFTLFLFIFLINVNIIDAEDPIENYNGLEYLEMSLAISSEVFVKETGDNPKIDFIKSDLSFFPKTSETQKVILLKPYSTYKADITEGENEIRYTWVGIPNDKIEYGYNSVIQVESDIARIKNKIKFPLTKVDSETIEYTQATEFIDITRGIEKKAKEVIGGEDDFYMAVYNVAEWTHKNVNYTLDTLTAEVVQPSSWVLKNKEGVCDEITNLFISLLRSVGIPARFVSGMVYSNTDYDWGAHGWAEVYFPEYGWVPFDVTFGEYGWIDPSHIKLKHDVDSGTPTAKYSWKANDASIDVGEINIVTEKTKAGPEDVGKIEVEVIPVKKSAGFGSYVPIEVKVKNLRDYYLSTKVIIAKAPELTEDNVKQILLEPKEEKSLYWIVKIPFADPDYIYTTTVEAKGIFGLSKSEILKYNDNFEVFSKEQAEALVSSYREREKKERLDEITLDCVTDKEVYYGGDKAEVSCDIQNYGNGPVNVNLCFQENCGELLLMPGEKKEEIETFEVKESFRLPVIVESENKVSYTYVGLNVIPAPELTISEPDPSIVSYKNEIDINFDVTSNIDINTVVINFDFGQLNYETIQEGEIRTITIHTFGKELMNDLRFDISYKDELNKEYAEKRALNIHVTDVPWYGKFVSWVESLFG